MFVIFFPTWNDMDWIAAQRNHIEAWEPDKIFLCEGCWDPRFPARSTDGTREYCESWEGTTLINNRRDHDYRGNQAATCNEVYEKANLKPGDWIMYAACDFFIHGVDTLAYKAKMNADDFCYPTFTIFNFWNSTKLYFSHKTAISPNLPCRIEKGASFKPTCHLVVDGKFYDAIPGKKTWHLPFPGFHYEGFRGQERLTQKYKVGDRQSPVVWKKGIKLKNRNKFNGKHPEFALPVLRKYTDGSI